MKTTADAGPRPDLEVLETWLADARETGVEDTFAGRRAHPRVTWQAPITVEILDSPEPVEPFYAYATDISQGGMGLRCRQRVEPFARLRVTLDETGERLCGQVQHHTETINGFIIGLRFELEDPEAVTFRKSA